MVKSALVTGATGFVGRQVLSPLLERGFELHAVTRDLSGVDAAAAGVLWHEVDLLDERATDALVRELRPSHLLHLAWYAEHGKFWNAPENLDWVASSLRLLRSFHAAGGRRAVIAGTCAEYDWTGDCCGDQTALEPATVYGISKNALRQLFEGYAGSSGFSAAWGRVFFTYGPGEQPTRLIAAAARAFISGETIQCSDGTRVRDFLYVADVADAFAALADSTADGTFDIGSGRGLTLREVLVRLEELAGRSGLVRFGEGPQRDEPARIVADTRRLPEELGWRPAHTLDDGLERTLAWWRACMNAAPR